VQCLGEEQALARPNGRRAQFRVEEVGVHHGLQQDCGHDMAGRKQVAEGQADQESSCRNRHGLGRAYHDSLDSTDGLSKQGGSRLSVVEGNLPL